jgi:hypothetical protein
LSHGQAIEARACGLLRDLAARTWTQIEAGERIGVRVGEESITDLLLLDLATRFPYPTKVVKWNRHQEARRTGADWDWWFVDSKLRTGVGLRIQAKRIDYFNQRFSGFDAANPYGPQREMLRLSGEREGLHPVYCLYLASPSPPVVPSLCPTPSTGNAPHGAAVFGCSLLGLGTIDRSLKVGDQSLLALWGDLLPWSCLACCEVMGSELITRVDGQAQRLAATADEKPASRITDNLPAEVLAVVDGEIRPGLVPDLGATVVTVTNDDPHTQLL